MLMIYLLCGYPGWTLEYTAAFFSTPRESPSIPRVVWGVRGHFTPQYSFKMGVGVRNLVEKISYNWKKLGGWVYFFCHGDFLPYLPGIFSWPPPPEIPGKIPKSRKNLIVPNLSRNFWQKCWSCLPLDYGRFITFDCHHFLHLFP